MSQPGVGSPEWWLDRLGRSLTERAGRATYTRVGRREEVGSDRRLLDATGMALYQAYYEGGLRVPLILRFAEDGPRGARYEHPVSLLDVPATVLAATGASLTDGSIPDGEDLAALVRGGAAAARRALFWRQGTSRAVRSGRWKLVARPRGEPEPRGRPPGRAPATRS